MVEVGQGAADLFTQFSPDDYARRGVILPGTVLTNSACSSAYAAASPPMTIGPQMICTVLTGARAAQHQACEVNSNHMK